MSWRQHLARFRAFLFHRDPTGDLDEEIRSHLEFEEEENLAAGMSKGEVRRAALVTFGNVTVAKENTRDMWVYRWLEDLLRDIRIGVRILIKNPGFTIVAGLTLGFGIGANAAIFRFADLIMHRPVALPDLDRLVSVSELVAASEEKGVSPANYLDWNHDSRSFASLAAYQYWSAVLNSQKNSEVVTGVRVTPNFLSTVGIAPALGRTFSPDEGQSGNDKVLIISDTLWKRQFGGARNVVGQAIKINRQPYTVIGVMPPKATFPLGAPVFWAPLAFTSQERSERVELAMNCVGRLAPGASVEQARAEVETHWMRLRKDYPEANKGRDVRVVHLLDDIVLDRNRQFVLLMLGVVGFVLLIACANVANLQLARAAGREREIALLVSLGARRARILSQLLTESILLAVAGGVLGLLLALWGVHVLRVTLPPMVQEFCDLADLRVDSRSLVFTLLITFFSGLLAGLVPAWQQTRGNLHDALKRGSGRLSGGHRHRLRHMLVIGQLALTLVLLIGAGLMVKGFAALLNANPSLQSDSLVTFHINLPRERYGEAYQARAFSDQLLARWQSLPGVESEALASGLPYSFYDDSVAIRIPGHPEPQVGQFPTVMPESISQAYFRTVHLPLREGREFDSRDVTGTARVAIVSESMARRFWPVESPIGKTLMLVNSDGDQPSTTVVGVVGDILHEVYDHAFRSILYLPYQQVPPHSMDFAVRTKGDAGRILATAQAQVQELDATLPIENLETMTRKIENQTSGLRYVAELIAIFGSVGLILSAVGVYGLMAYSVNARRREIGIRMALGAQHRDVLALVMRSGVLLTLFGLMIGIVFALALTRLVASLLYGVSSWDAAAFTGVPTLLAVVAMIASYIPARRATRVDPMIALRYE